MHAPFETKIRLYRHIAHAHGDTLAIVNHSLPIYAGKYISERATCVRELETIKLAGEYESARLIYMQIHAARVRFQPPESPAGYTRASLTRPLCGNLPFSHKFRVTKYWY